MYVGVDGVETFLLQLIGGNLVHQTDAATFLLHIDDDAATFLLDHLHGLVKLFAAVATLRTEDVARHTRGVDAHQHRLVLTPLALDERHVLQTVRLLTEGNQTEVAVLGRHIDFLALLDEALFLQTVGDHVLDGDDLQVVLLGKLHELGHAGHSAVVVHDLNERTGRVEACQLAEVDGGLGMARAAQHTIVLRIEGIDMARTPEGLGCRRGVGQGADGGGTVVG